MTVRMLVVSGFLLLTASTGWALDPDAPLADPAQRELYERLTREVRCLVCQNQTIADSTAPLAADLRREIRKMVEAGQSEQQIKTFLTDRYGDFVLYRPRYTLRNAVLWLAPALLLVFGALWWWRIIARRSTLPIPDEDNVDRPGGGLAT